MEMKMRATRFSDKEWMYLKMASLCTGIKVSDLIREGAAKEAKLAIGKLRKHGGGENVERKRGA